MNNINDLIHEITENIDVAAAGAVLTFLTILFTFYNKVAIPMYNKTLKPIVHLVQSIYDSPVRLGELNTKLDHILSELKPNGGASLKDQLNRLESQVVISEAQRRLLMDNSAFGIWASDKNGKCTWFNSTFKTKVDATSVDLEGDNWVNCIHPEDRRQVIDEWESVIATGRNFSMFYRVINLKTQATINVKALATPAKTFNGDIIGWNGTIYFL